MLLRKLIPPKLLGKGGFILTDVIFASCGLIKKTITIRKGESMDEKKA